MKIFVLPAFYLDNGYCVHLSSEVSGNQSKHFMFLTLSRSAIIFFGDNPFPSTFGVNLNESCRGTPVSHSHFKDINVISGLFSRQNRFRRNELQNQKTRLAFQNLQLCDSMISRSCNN